MKKELSVQKTISINANREKVWDALTDPDKIKEYFMGTHVKTDWKVGSPISFEGEHEGKNYMDKGTIMRNEKPKILQYDYWSSFSGLPDTPDNYSVVTYTLEDMNGSTKVTATQEGFANPEAQKHADVSWDMVLKNLKEVCEK